MYFPYLDNRQSEISALKVLAVNNKLDNVIPIISTNFASKDIDFSDNEAILKKVIKIFNFVETLIKHKQNFILLFDDSLSLINLTIEEIHNILIKEFNLDEELFNTLCSYGLNDFDLNNIGNNKFLTEREIAIFYNEEPREYSKFQAKYNILTNHTFILDFVVMNLNNKVSIIDSFISQSSNKNYPSFDRFQTYAFNYKNHHLFGFGDYTILNPNIAVGGGGNMNHITIAIHLLFKSKNENIMSIAHYLCEPSDEPNYGDRFMSAISKLKVDLSRFEKTIGLNTLINLDKATSLPKLKEHSIVHHIEVMSKY
jgi:hypothetical protein